MKIVAPPASSSPPRSTPFCSQRCLTAKPRTSQYHAMLFAMSFTVRLGAADRNVSPFADAVGLDRLAADERVARFGAFLDRAWDRFARAIGDLSFVRCDRDSQLIPIRQCSDGCVWPVLAHPGRGTVLRKGHSDRSRFPAARATPPIVPSTASGRTMNGPVVAGRPPARSGNLREAAPIWN